MEMCLTITPAETTQPGPGDRNRLAIFIPSLCGGGVERMMVSLAAGLADTGDEVDLVLARAEGPFLACVPAGVSVVDLGSRRVAQTVPGLIRYLRRARPRALLSGMWHANVVAIAARALARVDCRLVVSVHSCVSLIASSSSERLDRLEPLMGRLLYPRADMVVAVSRAVARDLATVSELAPELITVIPNPVAIAEITVRAAAPVNLPAFADGQPPVVLGVGRLAPEKNFALLVEAYAELASTTSAQLVILGEGPERAALAAQVARFGLQDSVTMPGFVDDLPGYLARAAVLVLTSRFEGFGNVLVEAMACGTPVVAVDCPGGPAEILDGGAYGPLVPPDDPVALAAAIGDMLRRPPPRERLLARAAEYDIARIAVRYREVLLAGR
jgi:glycosyltransferase involved in cell wall biosynthesis